MLAGPRFGNDPFGAEAFREQFGPDPREDPIVLQELFTEAELNVGLPPGNATLLSLSQQALREIREEGRKKQGPAAARRRWGCTASPCRTPLPRARKKPAATCWASRR